MVLKPGDYTEQVVVEADATTLRAGNSAVGEVFDGETLLTVPVSERDVTPVRHAGARRGAAGARARASRRRATPA